MLRAIKQKIQERPDMAMISKEVDQALLDEPEGSRTISQTTRIVSHVPVSVTGSLAPASASSSISSGRCQFFESSSSYSETGAAVHASRPTLPLVEEDSSPESSPRLGPLVAPLSPLKTHHKRSISDLQVSDVDYRSKKPRKVTLLARPDDASVLHDLHVFIRRQIEVFAATSVEMAQPAPGRKNPIQLHQIGLRCIHCSHLPARERVKRAVCYPTSVGRIYHSVSDMKFDHFSNCRGLSKELKSKLEKLKVQCKGREKRGKGGSSSTAQYYHDCARRMGMVDGHGGIYFSDCPAIPRIVPKPPVAQKRSPLQSTAASFLPLPQSPTISAGLATAQAAANLPLLLSYTGQGQGTPQQIQASQPSGETVPLASSLDEHTLNPLHCFVRRHVEVFAATQDDIDAPAPGRKTRVVLGQVGIRCRHCAKLPPKERVKRAVCYPPSVSGIYHAVSNMKFDHFGICKGLPDQDRAEFQVLKTTCGRRSGSRAAANSTAQFYYDSAERMGLVDTPTGIRFQQKRRDCVPDSLSALVIAAIEAKRFPV